MEVLSSAASGEQADPEVLEALIIVGLAHPVLASRMSVVPVNTGRRLAVRLERRGEIDRTLALLEVLLAHFPGQDTLERDLAAVMRRQGMVQNLVERYFERAQRLIREGRHQEAIGWLREVLQLDRSRKDAARLIRDLRFRANSSVRHRSVRWKVVVSALALSVGLSFLALREIRLREKFKSIPQAAGENLGSLRRRLGDLEEFFERYPVWHGAFAVVSERSKLRVAVERLEAQERAAKDAQEARERERVEGAQLARNRGKMKAGSGDIAAALAEFELALQLGGPDWPQRQEVEKDVAAMRAYLRTGTSVEGQ
jgi:tetratricopeptide (TPR) repeat protein